MSTQPVLVTGADGQLARRLIDVFSARVPVAACSRTELDITDNAGVMSRVAELNPSIILNCAAYNDVDGAEDHPVEALKINAFAVRSLARAAQACGAQLVHYSTDFVFNGSATQPYTEDDPPSPDSTYAASKLLGEWFARDAGRWLVLRVESLFGVRHSPETRRIGSIDRIIDAIDERRPVKVFRDRVVSPSYLVDVATATASLIDRRALSGVYHTVNGGSCTWYELAQEIAMLTGVSDEHLEPINASELPLRASRPLYAALSNDKLGAYYVMPSWQDALKRYLAFRRAARSQPPSRQ